MRAKILTSQSSVSHACRRGRRALSSEGDTIRYICCSSKWWGLTASHVKEAHVQLSRGELEGGPQDKNMEKIEWERGGLICLRQFNLYKSEQGPMYQECCDIIGHQWFAPVYWASAHITKNSLCFLQFFLQFWFVFHLRDTLAQSLMNSGFSRNRCIYTLRSGDTSTFWAVQSSYKPLCPLLIYPYTHETSKELLASAGLRVHAALSLSVNGCRYRYIYEFVGLLRASSFPITCLGSSPGTLYRSLT